MTKNSLGLYSFASIKSITLSFLVNHAFSIGRRNKSLDYYINWSTGGIHGFVYISHPDDRPKGGHTTKVGINRVQKVPKHFASFSKKELWNKI